MGFEHLSLIAEVDTETSLLYSAMSLAAGAIGWWGVKVFEPGIRERRERREKEFNMRMDREEKVALATIEEMRLKRTEEKEARDAAERKRQEEHEKAMLAMETRGARETSHMKALEAVADGQKQNLLRLERMEEDTIGKLNEVRAVLRAVLQHLRVEYEWEPDDVRPASTDGKPATGGGI